MRGMCSLTWPDKKTKESLDRIVFETQFAPFSIAQYQDNKPIIDFVGRKEELHQLKEQILKVVLGGKSRAVQLSGPHGVGKSTLFNYLKDSIEDERVTKGQLLSPPNFLVNDVDIFSSYFPMPKQLFDFTEIWEPMLKGLQPGFEKEIQADVTLPEYVVYHFIFRLLQMYPQGISPIIWNPGPPPVDFSAVKLKDIVEPLKKRKRCAVTDLQSYFNINKQEIREKLVVEINGTPYKITRTDNTTLFNLFRVLDEDDSENYLDRIVKRENPLFDDNDKLIIFFNDLMRFYTCFTRKKPILLVGIDEVAKAPKDGEEEIYSHLGNVFLSLRNSLDFVLFVFISTDDDWGRFKSALQSQKALEGQLSEFMFKLLLKQLEVDEVVQVFRNRMNHFWEHYSSARSPVAPYYPFSDPLFEYIFRSEDRKLREAIHFLETLWSSFRFNRRVPKLEFIFECMRTIWLYKKKTFDPNSLRDYDWKIIRKAFSDPQRYQNNSLRSSSIERGLESAWKVLAQEPVYALEVQRIPKIKMKSGNLRSPDVVVKLNANLGAEYRRVAEFQVKAYIPGSSVELKHIKSSLELFKEQYTDLIYFIITGKGLAPDAEAEVKNLEANSPDRIRRPVLSEIQENCLYLLALFKEITNTDLGAHEDRTRIVQQLLQTILGQTVEEFLKEVKSLTFRPPNRDIIEELPPEPDDTNTEVTDIETPLKPTPESPLWITYPDLKQYRHELCALCSYLRSRETGQNKYKFVEATVQKNSISINSSLKKEVFSSLVKELKKQGYIEKSSTTAFKLTSQGEKLYYAIKTVNFQC